MTAPAPSKKGGSPLGWVKTHEKQAGLGAAGVVVLLALRARASANGGSGGLLSGLTGGSSSGTATTVAGLSGTPNTTLTDMQNQLQDQLNTALGQFQSNVNGEIANIPAGPPGPAGKNGAPAPAPRPAPKPTGPPGRRPAPPPSSAHLRAVYDNELAHSRAAQAQYAKAPNAANRKLVQTYIAGTAADQKVYEASLPKAVKK